MAGNSFQSKLLYSILQKIFAIKENTDKNLGEVKRILVIRQHNQLGDMLAGISLFRALKEKYPNSHVTLLSSIQNYQGVVKSKFIDELIVFDKSKLFNPINFIAFLKKIRKQFDVAIVPVTVSISFTSNLVARLSNSKIRIGPNSLDGRPNNSAFFFDRRVSIDWRKFPDSNVSEHILEIVKPFGIDTNNLNPEIYFDNSDLKEARHFVYDIVKDSESLIIGIHVGAGKPANRWSLKNYLELIDKLNKEYSCTFYLTGSDADKDELEFINLNTNSKLYMFVNKQIPLVAALISISDLFITNDTGIMHVAGSTSTPQISLFGPTNPFNWAPCGKNKIFLRKSDLIDDVEVEDVFNVCKVILKK
ncbi:MAG: glycosyltransferase family 9 protein [Ignavibacteriales bacterium]|nr:glycosyltransferase family 9 protein [Ignavibacteriales bacterium]